MRCSIDACIIVIFVWKRRENRTSCLSWYRKYNCNKRIETVLLKSCCCNFTKRIIFSIIPFMDNLVTTVYWKHYLKGHETRPFHFYHSIDICEWYYKQGYWCILFSCDHYWKLMNWPDLINQTIFLRKH